MDKLKDPSLYLSGAALATAIGGTFYANHRVNTLTAELKDLSTKVAAQLEEVGKLQVIPVNMIKLSTAIRRLNEEHLALANDFDDYQNHMEQLTYKTSTTEEQLEFITRAIVEIQHLISNQNYNINYPLQLNSRAPTTDLSQRMGGSRTHRSENYVARSKGYSQPQFSQDQFHQPQFSQPQVHQPQVHQPQVHQPQVHQPQIPQPQIPQPQVIQQQHAHNKSSPPHLSRASRRRRRYNPTNNYDGPATSEADDIMDRIGV